MGLVLLLPIDPTRLLICYDAGIYEQIDLARALSQEDIANLNHFQMLSGVEGLYSTQLDEATLAVIVDVLKEKKGSKIINVDLPGDYLLTYKEYTLPNLPLTFLREKEDIDRIPLGLPYRRQSK